MKFLHIALLTCSMMAVSACDSDDDDDGASPAGPDSMGETGGESMGTTSLVDLASVPINGQPVDDGLDQVNADIMILFGDPDGEPVSINDDDTVPTIISRTQQAQ